MAEKWTKGGKASQHGVCAELSKTKVQRRNLQFFYSIKEVWAPCFSILFNSNLNLLLAFLPVSLLFFFLVPPPFPKKCLEKTFLRTIVEPVHRTPKSKDKTSARAAFNSDPSKDGTG